MSPLASVVIPVGPRHGRPVERLVCDLDRQSVQGIEILIVTDGTTANQLDDELNTANRSMRQPLKILSSDLGRAGARNVGIEQSTSRIIFSLDADMRVPAKVIEEGISLLESGYDAGIVPERATGTTYWARCKDLEKRCYVGTSVEAARVFDRAAWTEIGGYDETLEFGEDWDLHLRLVEAGFDVGRTKTPISHDEQDLSLMNDLRKKFRYGRTFGRYSTKHPRHALDIISPSRIVFPSHWPILIQDFPHAVGLVCMKGLEYFAAGLGYLLRNR